jgi:hypothetical protein
MTNSDSVVPVYLILYILTICTEILTSKSARNERSVSGIFLNEFLILAYR